MKKALTLIAALSLLAAGAAAQQGVHDARNGMLNLIWGSDNEEIVELWVAFRMEENAASPAAGWLLGEEIPLLSTDPPAASVARNEVLDIITEAEDADVVAVWTAFENAKQAGPGLVTSEQKGRGKESCYDHVPETLTVPAGLFPSFTIPTRGLVKASCHSRR